MDSTTTPSGPSPFDPTPATNEEDASTTVHVEVPRKWGDEPVGPDTLKVTVDAGSTYYVTGVRLTHAVVRDLGVDRARQDDAVEPVAEAVAQHHGLLLRAGPARAVFEFVYLLLEDLDAGRTEARVA